MECADLRQSVDRALCVNLAEESPAAQEMTEHPARGRYGLPHNVADDSVTIDGAESAKDAPVRKRVRSGLSLGGKVSGRRHPLLRRPQAVSLRWWLWTHQRFPYPTTDEVHLELYPPFFHGLITRQLSELAKDLGLTRTQIGDWFR
jgi:hypothetical protein